MTFLSLPKTSFASLLLASLTLVGCASETVEDEVSETEESALIGRSTREICDGANAPWTLESATDAFACANRRFWSTRYTPAGVHQKFYVHRAICTMNPASHYAMQEKQALFYCSLSLHLRM